MKLFIALFSKGRADTITRMTLRWLRGTKYDAALIVEPQDWKAYGSLGFPLITLPENNRGLCYAKTFVEEYAKEHGYDVVFKMDDDVVGWYGRDRKRSQSPLDTFEAGTDDCLAALEKWPDVKAISFPYSHEMYEVKKWVAANARLQSCYLIRTGWMGRPDMDVPIEDFYSYVYIRANNGITMRYGFMGQDCDVGKLKGGHQSYDRRAKMLQAVPEFLKLHPAIQFREKENSTWGIEPVLRGDFFGYKGL